MTEHLDPEWVPGFRPAPEAVSQAATDWARAMAGDHGRRLLAGLARGVLARGAADGEDALRNEGRRALVMEIFAAVQRGRQAPGPGVDLAADVLVDGAD